MEQKTFHAVMLIIFITLIYVGLQCRILINGSDKVLLNQRWSESQLKKPNISLDDVLITVKTSRNFFESRLNLLLRTWIKNAMKKTYIITDKADDVIGKLLGNHLVETNCESDHQLQSLCCKTGEEFATYWKKKNKWWCHFDDDVYVNLEVLVKLLSQYDPDQQFVHIGELVTFKTDFTMIEGRRVTFHHLTGATYCLSRALAIKVEPWLNGKNFSDFCVKQKLVDDLAISFVVNIILNVTSIHSDLFHSHLEGMVDRMTGIAFENQATFSYDSHKVTPFDDEQHLAFNKTQDPTRFLSLHCLFYPQDDLCRRDDKKAQPS